jgi:hypothetical protein
VLRSTSDSSRRVPPGARRNAGSASPGGWRRPFRLGATWAGVVVVLLACAPAAAQTRSERETPSLGGSLAWIFSDDLDLVGDMWSEFPVTLGPTNSLYFAVDAMTSIERAGTLAFQVRDVNYTLEGGWRHGSPAGPGLQLFVGQAGRQNVDAEGSAYIRYAGVGWESKGGRRAQARLGWAGSIAIGGVWDRHEVEGDAIIRGALRFRHPWKLGGVGFDARIESLPDFDAREDQSDIELGPHLGFDLAGGRRFDLFVHYLRGRHPLRLEVDAVLVGFLFDEDGTFAGIRESPPDVLGVIAAGAGDRDAAGRLKIQVLTPSFFTNWRGELTVDGNLLTGGTDDIGELFYFYDLGVEVEWSGLVVGGYYYHRSNHQWSQPNPVVTSINVLEGGFETTYWDRPPDEGSIGRGGRVDWRFRPGFLLNSTFGEDRWWHVRGGIRYIVPVRAAVRPFLLAEAEAGDISRQLYAVGLLHRSGVDFRVEYRDDDQYFGEQTATLGLVSFGY